MPKNNHNPEIIPTRSVNIRLIKPSGISSILSWFGKKNKSVNLQNAMFDKNFKLKLNPEEFNNLKQNGIDIQKLKNLANNDKKVPLGENIFIIPKDQIQLNKNDLINNSVLTTLLKNKDNFNNARKYDKSIISSSTISIKSKKKEILNSDFTYIHRIKSKKSVVKTVNSKASFKVGLKNNTGLPVNVMNKSVLIKNIPTTLIKENKQKKVFVPVYLGRKKSDKIIKTETNQVIENSNKFRPDDQSYVIPLLLTKIKNLEGQLTNIDNTTKKINEVVSNKTLLKQDFPSLNKKNGEKNIQQNIKGVVGHKIYPKYSSKKFRQIQPIRTDKNKNVTPINSKYSFKNLTDTHTLMVKNNLNKNGKNIKDILKNPEILLKTDNFVIPSNISEKNLFQANPNAGCDIILKLYEILSEANDSSNTNDSNEENATCKQQIEIGLKVDEVEKSNNFKQLCSAKLHSSPFRKYKSLSSLNGPQRDKPNDKQHSIGKMKITVSSCPSSSRYNINEYNTHVISKENVVNEIKQNNNNVVNKSSGDSHRLVLGETEVKDSKLEDDNKLNTHDPDKSKSVNEDCKTNKVISDSVKHFETNQILSFKSIQEKTSHVNEVCNSGPVVKSEVPKIISDIERNEIKLIRNGIEKNEGSPSSQTIENIPIVDANSTGGEICTLPIAIDSRNICSISIKQGDIKEDDNQFNTQQVAKGRTLSCLNTKKEAKFSITILLEKSSNDEINLKNHSEIMKKDCTCKELKNDQTGVSDENHTLFEVKENISINKNVKLMTNPDSEKEESFTTRNGAQNISVAPESRTNVEVMGINNLNGEKDIPIINEEEENNFGLTYATYLNREQRKVFDRQLMNAQYSKNNEKTSKPKFKQMAKSFTNLKNATKPIRHLSESSLDAKKSVTNSHFKTNTLHYSKTLVKLTRNQRKTPFYLDCIRMRKETDLINKRDISCNNKNQVSLQEFYTKDKDIMGKKEEFCINRSSLDCFTSADDYFETIKRSLCNFRNENDYRNKQNFIMIKDSEVQVNPSFVQTNSGDFNSLDSKKRSCRFSLTLKQNPIIEETEEDLFCDEMSVGDHQEKTYRNSFKNIHNIITEKCCHQSYLCHPDHPDEKKSQTVEQQEHMSGEIPSTNMSSFVNTLNQNLVPSIQNDVLVTDAKPNYDEDLFNNDIKDYFTIPLPQSEDTIGRKPFNTEVNIDNEAFCCGSCFNTSENIFNDIPETEDKNIFLSNRPISTVSAPSHLLELNTKLINYYNKNSENYGIDKLIKAKIILDYNNDENTGLCELNEDYLQEKKPTSEVHASQNNPLQVDKTYVKQSLSTIDEIPKEDLANFNSSQFFEENNISKECCEKSCLRESKCKRAICMPASKIAFTGSNFVEKNHLFPQQQKCHLKKTSPTSKIIDKNNSQERTIKKKYMISDSDKSNVLSNSAQKEIKISRNFLVNCVYRIEYDILRKNENSYITCSLNTCPSSTK